MLKARAVNETGVRRRALPRARDERLGVEAIAQASRHLDAGGGDSAGIDVVEEVKHGDAITGVRGGGRERPAGEGDDEEAGALSQRALAQF